MDPKDAGELIESLKRLSIMISNRVDHLKHSGMREEKFNNDSIRSNRSGGVREEKVPTVKARSSTD